jgi:protocatechuate 3,4-dioxygenase, beta subunit
MHTKENRHRTPDQNLGPFFPIHFRSATSGDLTAVDGAGAAPQGEVIEVTGRVLDLDGEPVRGARLTIWQANSFGRYRHDNDHNVAPLDPNFAGYARIRSNDDGSYAIKTIKPGAYPVGPEWMRPPHIHFEVQGRSERLVTQMYFPGEDLNKRDRLLAAALRPELLVAAEITPQQSPRCVLNFDIVLVRG